MFVGHYSASFLAKSVDKNIPLWVMFIAVQLVDVFWAIFVIFGIEQVRITPGFTRSNDLDLFFMPYTHSLVGAALWSIVAGVAYLFWRKGNSANGIFATFLVGFAVFSHWILDLIVHTPDLSLYDDSFKMGFGLWNQPSIAFPLEILLLIGGLWIYMRSTKAVLAIGNYAMPGFVVLLLIVQTYALFGPSPTTPTSFAITSLAFYLGFGGIALWLDRFRN